MAGDITTVRDISDHITNRCLEVKEYARELNSLTQAMGNSMDHIEMDPPLFDIGAVKTAHLNWKIQLEAVLEGRKKMQADQVTDHHGCEFGKWYDRAREQFSGNAIFQRIEAPHKTIHATARDIVSLYNQEKEEAAQARLRAFEEAREELFRLLDELYLS